MRYLYHFWDWDGTLFDSYPAMLNTLHRVLKDNNIQVSRDRLFPLLKQSVGKAITTMAEEQGKNAEELHRMYCGRAEKEENEHTILPFEGVRDILEKIVRLGGKNYLYTHRGSNGIAIAKHYQMLKCFSDAITKDDDFPRKPAPDALLHLLTKHRLDPRRCVMIGDRAIDADAGHNAGMSAIIFDPDRLCGKTSAEFHVHSAAELSDILFSD